MYRYLYVYIIILVHVTFPLDIAMVPRRRPGRRKLRPKLVEPRQGLRPLIPHIVLIESGTRVNGWAKGFLPCS